MNTTSERLAKHVNAVRRNAENRRPTVKQAIQRLFDLSNKGRSPVALWF